MNVNKVVGNLVFVILCSFIILPKISAFNICDDKNCDGSTETEEGKSLKYHDNKSGYLFYCTQPNQPWPHTCSYSTTFSQRFSAAVSYIIAKERNTDSMTYNGAQRTISKFLFNNWENGHGNKLRQNWSLNDSQKAVYNKAKKIFDNNTKIKFEQTSLSFNTSNKATVKYKEIETPFDIYCSVRLTIIVLALESRIFRTFLEKVRIRPVEVTQTLLQGDRFYITQKLIFCFLFQCSEHS